MPKPTFYRIIDRSDGLFDVEVMVAGSATHHRRGFMSLAELDAALDELRSLMTACGAPLLRADFDDASSTEQAATSKMTSAP